MLSKKDCCSFNRTKEYQLDGDTDIKEYTVIKTLGYIINKDKSNFATYELFSDTYEEGDYWYILTNILKQLLYIFLTIGPVVCCVFWGEHRAQKKLEREEAAKLEATQHPTDPQYQQNESESLAQSTVNVQTDMIGTDASMTNMPRLER